MDRIAYQKKYDKNEKEWVPVTKNKWHLFGIAERTDLIIGKSKLDDVSIPRTVWLIQGWQDFSDPRGQG